MSRQRAPFTALLVAGLLWVGGFAWFARDADRSSRWPSHADGIVVLTGGALRIETALALLRSGVADRLLISGVPRGISLPSLLDAATDAPVLRPVAWWPPTEALVAVGHSAGTTRGNAVETAAWAEESGLHDIVVVTAGYHMRRALAELALALPDARFHAYAVHPSGTCLRVLFTEYNKFLAVEAGLLPPPRAADSV